MADPGGSTAVLLLTDIEASSTKWLRHGARMRDALARHDAIMRSAIVSAGGTILKTAGDAFVAEFAIASAAFEAAIDAQRIIGEADWTAVEGLAVRMAVCGGTGLEALTWGDRFLSLAHGGQVITTEQVASRAPAFGFHPLETLPLSLGSDGPSVLQLEAPGLRSAFPLLRDADRCPTNIPDAPPAEPETVERLLASSRQTRWATLTGADTARRRWAIISAGHALLARDGADRPPRGGVWLIESEDADDFGSGRALGVVPGLAGLAFDEQIKLLEIRDLLLLIVSRIESAAMVSTGRLILDRCPRVRVLASATRPIGLPGEQLVMLTQTHRKQEFEDRAWPVIDPMQLDLLARLSTFVDAFSLEDVEAIGEEIGIEADEALASLATMGLVTADPANGRSRLAVGLGEWALARSGPGVRAAAVLAHAAAIRRSVDGSFDDWLRLAPAAFRDRYAPVLPDLLAALERLLDAGHERQALALAAAGAMPLAQLGEPTTAALLARAARVADTDRSRPGHVLLAQGWLLASAFEPTAGLKLLEAARAFREQGNVRGEAMALLRAADRAWHRGDSQQAIELTKMAEAPVGAAGAERLRGWLYEVQAKAAETCGDLVARDSLLRSAARARSRLVLNCK